MRIINVKYLNDYKLAIVFYNEKSIVFDFESFLKQSHHNSISKYLDKNKFKKVELITGFLSWNNGELEISGEWIWDEISKPNSETIKAIEDTRKGKVTKTKNVRNLMKKLNE